MRTNIVIDDTLMNDVLQLTTFKTKKEAVEEGLKVLLRLAKQQEVKQLRGNIQWLGDLNAMRIDQ
jgi:Arc/MetJ family transcription regulator